MDRNEEGLSGLILDNKYKLERKIGSGGTGEVYEAYDLHVGKRWAVKYISAGEGSLRDRFFQEIKAEVLVLRKAEHRNLPRIVDFISIETGACIVMDFVEGSQLQDIIETFGPPSRKEGLRIAVELAETLAYLHSLTPPVIYRDMKPSNIIMQENGQIKLVDFGAAKPALYSGQAGEAKAPPGSNEKGGEGKLAMGTAGYAAPEQYGDARGRERCDTDCRTDIYSLGVTLLYLFSGEKPETSILEEDRGQSRAALSAGVSRILSKCTRKDPQKRYQTADELLADLKKCQNPGKLSGIGEIAREYLLFLLTAASILLTACGLAQTVSSAESLYLTYWDAQNHTIGRMRFETGERLRMVREWKNALLDRKSPLYELELEYSHLLAKGYESFAGHSKEKKEDYYRRAAVCYENILKLAGYGEREVRASACYSLAGIYEKLGEEDLADYYSRRGEGELWEQKN